MTRAAFSLSSELSERAPSSPAARYSITTVTVGRFCVVQPLHTESTHHAIVKRRCTSTRLLRPLIQIHSLFANESLQVEVSTAILFMLHCVLVSSGCSMIYHLWSSFHRRRGWLRLSSRSSFAETYSFVQQAIYSSQWSHYLRNTWRCNSRYSTFSPPCFAYQANLSANLQYQDTLRNLGPPSQQTHSQAHWTLPCSWILNRLGPPHHYESTYGYRYATPLQNMTTVRLLHYQFENHHIYLDQP